jgi:ribonuclease-3
MQRPKLERLAGILGHSFARPEWLAQALVHPSAAKRGPRPVADYQRLEFLGDRVLGLVIADLLFEHFPDAEAGALAPRYNALVRRETLASVARDIGLGAFLQLAPSERAMGGAGNPSILADACEAVIAALYQDGGLAAVRAFIERHWRPLAEGLTTPPTDAKTMLQEWAQAHGSPPPAYSIVAREGPPHRPLFTVEVALDDGTPAAATGRSKREAEQAAAAALLSAQGEGDAGDG